MKNRLIIFVLTFVLLSCANRGYDTLSLEVPEFFPGFNPDLYEINETPKNIMYVQKSLPKEQKQKLEFIDGEYQLIKKSAYLYYVPVERKPSSFIDKEKYKNWPKIKLNDFDALLIK